MQTTTVQAMEAAGFQLVRTKGRTQIWTGTDATGGSMMRVFDSTTGIYRDFRGDPLEPVQTAAAIGAIGLALLDVIAALPVDAGAKAALSAQVMAAIG